MLRCGRFTLPLTRPLIMGIVNVTPDSFSDGGRFFASDRAIAHGLTLVGEGADLLDIGGESTRPGAAPVPLDEELERVLPVVEGLRQAGVPLSVDTQKPAVMRAALAAGADMINDVNALRAAGAVEVVAPTNAAVCLMHMQGEPRTMQLCPTYTDVVGEVRDFLDERLKALEAAGIARERIVIDPGFGFGKNLQHNLDLLRRLDAFATLGVPVLAGLSRKSMLGQITGKAVEDRLHASVAAALIAALKGARILRVHDVAATRDALAVLAAVQGWGE
ncbi:MAG: dihydropteroate synthase [Burkholderiales bacterium]|jgi:dihydropteroate synthase|nr:dihydropteroate synthase [Burkholderiales bacterium]